MAGMPGSGAIGGSVLGGLGTRGDLSPQFVPSIHFYPSLGIIAGRINKLNVDIRSFRKPLHDSIKNVMVPSIRRNFDEGGRPQWEPLSEFTITMRAAQGYGPGPILDRTGALKIVATQINLWDIGIESAVIRDIPQKVWYGKVHQSGYGGMGPLILKHAGNVKAAAQEFKNQAPKSGRASPDIPARPFLVYQEEDIVNIRLEFTKWLAERVAIHWGRK